ncbi:MAG: zinc-ribbon domain-containing protein [Thermodesulfobacteriota bacterium]|nr:zinc-ribbon domain-containing protein [Thermodesulfobacteriota bacterium]
MEVVCDNCNAKLNIPDGRIPQGQRIAVSCPKCKKKLTINAESPREEDSAPAADKTTDAAGPNMDTRDGLGTDSNLDFYEEGVKLALVMESDPQQVDQLRAAVEELGYRYVLAESTRAAITNMRFHHFDLVILSDPFDGIGAKQSPILRHLNHLSMSIRRRIFFALIGDSFKTMDHMMAFAMSANLVIGRKDIDQMATVFKSAISDNQKFYKVFIDTLVEAGKG